MKCAIYIRVSSVGQSQNGYSLDGQLSAIKKFIELKEWSIYNIYKDVGTGRNTKREQYKKMMLDINNWDVLVIYKLDRLNRSLLNSLKFMQLLDQHKKNFVSVTENIDTSSPYGKMFFQLIGAFAEMESELISDRTKFGLLEKVNQGKRYGGHIPFAYRLVDGELIIEESEAIIVRRIFQYYTEYGKTMLEIADMLNRKHNRIKKWYSRTVGVLIRNPLYAGYHRFKDLTYKGTHEAIIDVKTYNSACEIINRRNGNVEKIEVEK